MPAVYRVSASGFGNAVSRAAVFLALALCARPLCAQRIEDPLSFIRLSGGFSYLDPGSRGIAENSEYNFQARLSPVSELTFSRGSVTTFGYVLELERDPLLMNRVLARIKGRWGDKITYEAGGFLGFLNPDIKILSPGVSLALNARLWPSVTARLRIDSALNRTLKTPGDFLQDLYDARIVLTRGHFVFDVLGTCRIFVRGIRGGLNVTSHWIKTGLNITFSNQNLFFDVGVSGGYQMLALRYPLVVDPLNYSFQSIFFGCNMLFRLSRSVDLFFDLDSSINALEASAQSGRDPLLLHLNVGISWALE
ncbi:MAG: hypothetical protein LBP20_03960, partial [Treponema sp.]|nr:hypothetical protein [Treponema sp.]